MKGGRTFSSEVEGVLRLAATNQQTVVQLKSLFGPYGHLYLKAWLRTPRSRTLGEHRGIIRVVISRARTKANLG